MAEDDERKGKFDDLFDDLDRFFSSEAEDAEAYPARPGTARPPQTEAVASGPQEPAGADTGDDSASEPSAFEGGEPGEPAGIGEEEPEEPEEPDLEGDLLPADWMPDVDSLSLPEEESQDEEWDEAAEGERIDAGAARRARPGPRTPDGPGRLEAPIVPEAPAALDEAERPDVVVVPEVESEAAEDVLDLTSGPGAEDESSWRPQVTAAAEGSRRPPPAPTEPIEETPAEAGEGLEPTGATEPIESESEWAPQATAEPQGEMSGDDWSRLREVLGEEEEEDEELAFLTEGAGETGVGESLFDLESLREAGAAARPPEEPGEVSEAPGPTLRAGGGEAARWGEVSFEGPAWAAPSDETEGEAGGLPPHAEEPHELTLEDLKKPPPQYRDLPGAEPEEEGEAMVVGEVPPSESHEPASRPFWEDVEVEDVEHAADEEAGEFGPPSTVEEDLLADLDQPSRPRTVRVGEPEALAGPSWEEPASRPLIPEPARPPGLGRNIPAALLTGLGLAALALIALAWKSAAFAVVASAVALIGQFELYATMQQRGFRPATALGIVVGAMTLAAAYLKGEPGMVLFVVIGIMASFLWYMSAPPKTREGSLGNIGATMFGVVYVPFLAGTLLIILSQGNSGRALMLTVLALTILYDVVAFAVGTLYGSTPLAPAISPKKTREGLIVASLATMLVGAALIPLWVDVLTIGKAAGLALIVVVFAPLGDLAESMIKRELGVKDMGSFLPGHGGALDRIDSILFVAPAAFYFIRLVF